MVNQYRRDYYRKNRDKIIRQNKEWRDKNITKFLSIAKQYRDTHKDELKIKRDAKKEQLALQHYNRYDKYKNKALEILGGKCANPYNLPHPDWCNSKECLQIDHINGGGTKERNKIGFLNILIKIVDKQNSNEYQLLCANCNWIKKYKNNEMPQRRI